MTQNSSAEVRLIASPRNWIEGSAVQQLEKTAALPGMRLAVGLPDLHPGKGSPVGAAFAVEDHIYPSLVGNDIGCGIGLWRTGLPDRASRREAWADRLRQLDGPWDGDALAFLVARGIAPSGEERSLGTVGSGNHFAELQRIERVESPAAAAAGLAAGHVYLCVHSGSRGFGEAVLRSHTDRYGAAGLTADSPDAAAYLARHDHAVHWAEANRELTAERILSRLRTSGERLIDLCHNQVVPVELNGRRCWLHRKGAAPSTGGPVVIPGSRGSWSYIVLPREPRAASAWSLAHGAGRKWSRSECRGRLEPRFTAQELTRTPLGSQVVCEDRDLLYEEAPQAYKNIDVVIADLVDAGLVEVLAVMRPLVTYKVRR